MKHSTLNAKQTLNNTPPRTAANSLPGQPKDSRRMNAANTHPAPKPRKPGQYPTRGEKPRTIRRETENKPTPTTPNTKDANIAIGQHGGRETPT